MLRTLSVAQRPLEGRNEHKSSMAVLLEVMWLVVLNFEQVLVVKT